MKLFRIDKQNLLVRSPYAGWVWLGEFLAWLQREEPEMSDQARCYIMKDEEYRETLLAWRTAADLALYRQSDLDAIGRIKPLEWTCDAHGAWSAATTLGPYEAREESEGVWRLKRPGLDPSLSLQPSLLEARLHAQLDWEARLLPSLSRPGVIFAEAYQSDIRALHDKLTDPPPEHGNVQIFRIDDETVIVTASRGDWARLAKVMDWFSRENDLLSDNFPRGFGSEFWQFFTAWERAGWLAIYEVDGFEERLHTGVRHLDWVEASDGSWSATTPLGDYETREEPGGWRAQRVSPAMLWKTDLNPSAETARWLASTEASDRFKAALSTIRANLEEDSVFLRRKLETVRARAAAGKA